MVWAVISSHEVIGPYFIEDSNGNPLTVNGEVHRNQTIGIFHADSQPFSLLNSMELRKKYSLNMEKLPILVEITSGFFNNFSRTACVKDDKFLFSSKMLR